MPLRIDRATVADVPLILAFIRELADYERALGDVEANEASLTKTLFGEKPQAEVVIGREGETPVGFALFFSNYSTWRAKHGIYLEDLFVRPEFRGKGYGAALLTHLAKLAVERDCGRLEWSVLDWNEPAIGFYKKLGAVPMSEWTVFRLTGDALKRVAAHDENV